MAAKHFSHAKPVANGALDGRRIELTRRARAGLAVAVALAIENLRRIESRDRWYSTYTQRHVAKKTYSKLDRGPEKLKFTPRESHEIFLKRGKSRP